MDKAQFWQLIEEAKEKSGGECEAQVDLIEEALLRLSAEEVIAFDRLVDIFRDQAYRWDLWGAASLINGGCSDDCFMYFGCWLIAQGQEVFENALRDPDSLSEIIEPDFADAECEALLYVGGRVYKNKTGQEMPEEAISAEKMAAAQLEPAGPRGTRWEEDELDALFPRIAAKIAVEE